MLTSDGVIPISVKGYFRHRYWTGKNADSQPQVPSPNNHPNTESTAAARPSHSDYEVLYRKDSAGRFVAVHPRSSADDRPSTPNHTAQQNGSSPSDQYVPTRQTIADDLLPLQTKAPRTDFTTRTLRLMVLDPLFAWFQSGPTPTNHETRDSAGSSSTSKFDPASWDGWPDGDFVLNVTHQEAEATKNFTTHWSCVTSGAPSKRGFRETSDSWEKGKYTRRQCLGHMKCKNPECLIIVRPQT